jgi:hypothetical protein
MYVLYQSEDFYNISLKAILQRLLVNPTPNPQTRVPPLISCPRLLIQYIRNCSPCLEAVSSIRNPKTQW